MKQKLFVVITILLAAGSLLTPVPVSADGKQGGSITCNTQNNQVWDIEGAYTDVSLQPVVSLYQGSTYIQHYTTSASNVQVSAQLAAQTTNQLYTLYNSADNSGAALLQATCTAKTVAVAPTTKPVTTPPKTPAAPAAAPTTSPATTPAATSPVIPDTATKTPSVAPSVKPHQASVATPVSAKDSESSKFSAADLLLLIVAGVLTLIVIVSQWIVFRKANRPGWGSIVPLYSSWLLFNIGGRSGWWAVLLLVPIINVVAMVILALAAIETAKRFGKSGLFGFFGLFVFSFIGWAILAFSKAHYTEPQASAVRPSETV